MSDEETHKFDEKMEISYLEYIKSRFKGMLELAREMEKELGREKALEIVGRTCDRMAVESVKETMKEREPIEKFEDFVSMMKELAESEFYKRAITCELGKETPESFEIRMIECVSARAFKELGDTDIGYVMCCKPDYATARAYHPKIGFKRTKSLMQGDEYCDPAWYWEE